VSTIFLIEQAVSAGSAVERPAHEKAISYKPFQEELEKGGLCL